MELTFDQLSLLASINNCENVRLWKQTDGFREDLIAVAYHVVDTHYTLTLLTSKNPAHVSKMYAQRWSIVKIKDRGVDELISVITIYCRSIDNLTCDVYHL